MVLFCLNLFSNSVRHCLIMCIGNFPLLEDFTLSHLPHTNMSLCSVQRLLIIFFTQLLLFTLIAYSSICHVEGAQ